MAIVCAAPDDLIASQAVLKVVKDGRFAVLVEQLEQRNPECPGPRLKSVNIREELALLGLKQVLIKKACLLLDVLGRWWFRIAKSAYSVSKDQFTSSLGGSRFTLVESRGEQKQTGPSTTVNCPNAGRRRNQARR
jgi:hypothetical protein